MCKLKLEASLDPNKIIIYNNLKKLNKDKSNILNFYRINFWATFALIKVEIEEKIKNKQKNKNKKIKFDYNSIWIMAFLNVCIFELYKNNQQNLNFCYFKQSKNFNLDYFKIYFDNFKKINPLYIDTIENRIEKLLIIIKKLSKPFNKTIIINKTNIQKEYKKIYWNNNTKIIWLNIFINWQTFTLYWTDNNINNFILCNTLYYFNKKEKNISYVNLLTIFIKKIKSYQNSSIKMFWFKKLRTLKDIKFVENTDEDNAIFLSSWDDTNNIISKKNTNQNFILSEAEIQMILDDFE